jgi:hypothetical protein
MKVNTGTTIHQKTFSNRVASQSTANGSQSAPKVDATTVSPEPNLTQPSSNIEPKVVDPRMQQALESLTRKEQEIRKAQQSLKFAQDKWRNEQGQYLSRKDLQEQTLKILNENGITNQRLIELQLGSTNQADAGPEAASDAKFAALEAEIASLKANTDQRDVQARTQAEQIVHNDAKLLVDNDPSYSVTKTLGMQGEVSKLIIQNYDATGEMLSIEEAARMVEAELTDRTLKQRVELDKLEAIQKRLAPREEGSIVPPSNASNPLLQPSVQNAIKAVQNRSSSTLTHRMGSTRPTTAYERAVQAFEAARLNK